MFYLFRNSNFLFLHYMPYKEREIEKIYYSIGEVAEIFQVSTSLIRFWEGEFDILKPKKNKKGNRLFSKEDIENLRLIFYLVKEKGHTLEGAKKRLKDKNSNNSNTLKIQTSLLNIKFFLESLKASLRENENDEPLVNKTS